MSRIAVVMDGGPERAETTVDALGHAAAHVGVGLDTTVVATDHLHRFDVAGADGVVIGPGSPYRRMDLVLETIRSAREKGVPLVGT
ncbi:MAG: hypothetical protein OES57_02950 [Acidimicrobiia bacterium]|nr:hypothetical protein [Acidimicrobiia bacterium]